MKTNLIFVFLCLFIIILETDAQETIIEIDNEFVIEEALNEEDISAQKIEININDIKYKNPNTASLLSLLLPGLGQLYNGQKSKGNAMILLSTGSCFLYFSFAFTNYYNRYDTQMGITLAALIGTYIWSIMDASISAIDINFKNRMQSRKLSNDLKLSIAPDLFFANSIETNKANYKSPAYGMTLKLNF